MLRQITITALVLIIPILAFAVVPRTISWQGIVEDDSGVPLQGNHSLLFRLYTVGSGGSHIWEETHALDLVDGLAEATMGSIQSLAGTNFDQPLWLGLTVDGGAELEPRAELTAVPYALAVDGQAAVTSLNGLSDAVNLVGGTNVNLVPNGNDITINATSGGGTDGDWNIVGNDLTLGVTGNVGVGNTNPAHKLDIRTPINVPVSVRLLSGGSWSAVLEQSPESVLTLTNGGSKRFAISPAGRVGIGTVSPQVLFHIDSDTRPNEMLIGSDTEAGGVETEDIGVRLSTEKLEFYKWLNLGEPGALVISAGIYSTGNGWKLEGIHGTAGAFNIGGDLTAEDGTFSGHVQPSTTSLWSLGSSSKRWSVVYAMAVDTPSDRRLKRDIEDLDYGLKELLEMRPVSYQWKEHPEKGRQLGLIAQDLRQIVPEIVNEAHDEDKSLSVEYMALIPVLIASLQEQQEQIREQGEMISRQTRALDELRGRLALQDSNLEDETLVAAASEQ